ncbi:hypothetical protein BLEM_0521 [Bifidobacterium lemurum]|uniref:AbiEi antitoxin C-terminal domain-containing protein n=1 Tax=Bifidobacterium lemurum TaxID=1603886 RepID=A0A261FV90_9BIFI|nr:hypothetical protein BLEM_0521 [Bifidobacterium lemurum]
MVPSILYTKDLPGPLSLNRLSEFGTLRKLDETAGYWSEHGGTLYGRATIVATVTPYSTVACSATAAWVWLGGAFPRTLDVISKSHFRSVSVGRRIRVFKRHTSDDQVMRIAELSLTTPQRTACDLVMMPEAIPDPLEIRETIGALMSTYRFNPSDCLDIVKQCRYHKFAARARMFFESMQRDLLSEPPDAAFAYPRDAPFDMRLVPSRTAASIRSAAPLPLRPQAMAVTA